MKTFYLYGEPEVYPIAREVLDELTNLQARQCHVITLSGELGSGKTSFVKIIGEILGISEQITSPTFTLMHSFPLSHTRFQTLYHLDLYRLSHHSEVQELGIHDLLQDSTALLLIEWPERASDLLSDTLHYQIHVSHMSPDSRRIDIYPPSDNTFQS